MDPVILQPENLDLAGHFPPNDLTDKEIISLDECKRYIGECGLTDPRILEIRNNMVGIVDRIINVYLENHG